MSDIRAQVSVLPTGEFRAGRVLSRAFKVLFQDFTKFFLIAFVVVLPYALLALMGIGNVQNYFGAPTQTLAGAGVTIIVAVSFGTLFLYAIGQAVTLYGAFQDMRGRPFNLGEALARGLRRFFPLIGLAIAWSFAMVLGFILLLIPGFMMLASFYVSLPACVVEELGPLQSMSRSAALTKGHRWKVFGIYILIFLVSAIVGSLVRIIFAGAVGIVGGILAGLVWNALFASYHSVLVAVMYHDLRVLKDGIDIDRIAAVFD